MESEEPFSAASSGQAGTGGGLRYIHETATPHMVNQEHNYSCVIACARQLLRDVGVEVPEPELVARIGIIEGWGARFEDVAEVLSELHPARRYCSGGVAPEEFDAICQKGAWIARVRTLGGRQHAIIVDGLEAGDLLAVRDPWGLTGPGSGSGTEATMRLSDFHEHWLRGIHYVIFPGRDWNKGGLS